MQISLTINIDTAMFGVISILIFLLILFISIDVRYYLNVVVIMLLCKVRPKRFSVDDTISLYGFSTTMDSDFYLTHMNNARFLRKLDFSRLHFYLRTGLYGILVKKRIIVLQNACTVRYRRPISIFTLYKVNTKIIYYDEKNIYFEHQFVTLQDGFVRTVVISKQTFVHGNAMEIMNQLLDREESFEPKMPSELEDWIEMNKKSSERLRKTD